MTDLDVLRVFCGPDGGGGNALGVVRDGSALPGAAARAALAAELGFSETVFLDDAARGTVDIHTPSVPLTFAGHPLVGVAWLPRTLGRLAGRGRGRGPRPGLPAPRRHRRRGGGCAAACRNPRRPRLRAGSTGRHPEAVDAARGTSARYAVSGNCAPSSRKTALFSRKARLHSSTTRCFSRSSTGSASSSARYSRLKAAGLGMSSKT